MPLSYARGMAISTFVAISAGARAETIGAAEAEPIVPKAATSWKRAVVTMLLVAVGLCGGDRYDYNGGYG